MIKVADPTPLPFILTLDTCPAMNISSKGIALALDELRGGADKYCLLDLFSNVISVLGKWPPCS